MHRDEFWWNFVTEIPPLYSLRFFLWLHMLPRGRQLQQFFVCYDQFSQLGYHFLCYRSDGLRYSRLCLLKRVWVSPCLYLKWRGKYFVLCVVWLEDAAYFFGMIAGDVSRCFTWPRVTGTPWFLHSYLVILLHFSSSLNKVGVFWILAQGRPCLSIFGIVKDWLCVLLNLAVRWRWAFVYLTCLW